MPYLLKKPDNTQIEVDAVDSNQNDDGGGPSHIETADDLAISDDEKSKDHVIARDRPRRKVQLPSRFSDYDMMYYALSVAEEVEYHEPSTYREAMRSPVKESFWLKGMLADFGINQEAVSIMCDSSSAICLTKHQTFHERSKHVDARLHFIRDEVNKGSVKVLKVSTEENAADMLTKTLPSSKLKHCLDLVKLVQH